MSSPKVILNFNQPVYLVYNCANCGFPIFTLSNIEGRVTKSVGFLYSKAEEIAQETVKDRINEEIERIGDCKKTKSVITEKPPKSDMIDFGHFCVSKITDLKSSCPLCGKFQPWATADTDISFDSLNDDNYPTVFTDSAAALNNAISKLYDMGNSLKSTMSIEDAKKKAIELRETIASLEYEVESLPEIQQKSDLERLKKDYEKQVFDLPFKEFKQKKELNNKIKEAEQKIDTLGNEIKIKKNDINKIVMSLKPDLLKAQALGYGMTGNYLKITKDNSALFYMEAKNPEATINNSENDSIEAQISVQNTAYKVKPIKIERKEVHNTNNVRFCRKCGNELSPGSIFCNKCGTKVI